MRLRQALMIVVNVVLALSLVAVVLNRMNEWYPTWSSFHPTIHVSEEKDVGQPLPAVQANAWVTRKASDLQAHPEKNPAFAGHSWSKSAEGDYLTVEVPGSGVGDKTTKTLLWLPPSYLSNPDRFYPVLVAFPGTPGTPSAYRKKMDIGQMVELASQRKEMREAIVVSPDVFPRNYDTECLDSTDGKITVDSYITSPWRNWLMKNLRIVPDRQAWAAIGYSAGGWCAAMVSMKHPDIYAYGINMSGYFWPTYLGKPLRPEEDRVYDLPTIAQEQAPDSHLWFIAAKNDTVPIEHWEKFVDKVHAPTSLHTVLTDNGGHAWPVWRAGTPRAFAWLGRISPEFAWQAA
ncbi:alpha/beta hydrolase [Trueperella sp. LYQ143]